MQQVPSHNLIILSQEKRKTTSPPPPLPKPPHNITLEDDTTQPCSTTNFVDDFKTEQDRQSQQ